MTDRTMKRLCHAMEENEITQNVVEKVGTTEECTYNGSAPRNSKQKERDKKKSKSRKAKKNRDCKETCLKIMQKYLTQLGWCNPINFKEEKPTTPLYSMMYSFEEGFSIVMYSGNHQVNLMNNLCIHYSHVVRVHLPA